MEPKQQVEIQLGHMCNNRCVFCVSGQRTEMKMARPLETNPILEKVEKAWADGNRKITLLGGEPTLQPGFMDIVKRCVELGFEEIVIFTNGVKTSRVWFVDQVVETGGNFTWRLSFQGADKASHEDTTKRKDSFDRLVQTLDDLHRRGERITVNMCVVNSNFRDVHKFPELLLPRNVQQLHLDMIRPLDSGDRTEEEMREMLPYYPDMVEPLTKMIEGFPEGFDVNIGNLPFCMAPHLAPWIHHDGETTFTISIEGDEELSEAWDKYEVKRRDKLKVNRCSECLFDGRCSGIFETWRDFYGTDDLKPVGPEQLAEADPERRLLSLHLRGLMRQLEVEWPEALGAPTLVETGETELVLLFEHDGGPLRVALRGPRYGQGSFDWFSVDVQSLPEGAEVDARETLRALWDGLVAQGHSVLHPLGDDVVLPVHRSIAARLARLRYATPFAGVVWEGIDVSDEGLRAEVRLRGPEGQRVVFWLTQEGDRATGGYRLDEGQASPKLVAGLKAVMGALRGETAATADRPR